MNGRATGRVGEVLDRDGALFASPAELTGLGFVLPRDIAAAAEPVPLAALPNVRARLDEATQTLVVEAADVALVPAELGSGSRGAPLAPLSPSGWGAVLDYDLSGTYSLQQQGGGGQRSTGGALLDLRAFSPYGVLQTTGLINMTPYPGRPPRSAWAPRIPTPNRMNCAAGVPATWSPGPCPEPRGAPGRRAVVQRFQPTPRPDHLSAAGGQCLGRGALDDRCDDRTASASSANRCSRPFAVRTLPVVTGAGEIAVTVLDALGRQTLVTMPFYASSALLKPGLASYSVEAGAVRQNYGLITDRYQGSAGSGSMRYGVTDWLTLESHAEATGTLAVFGAGAAVGVGSLGVFNAAVSGSKARGALSLDRSAGGDAGGQASAGFRRVSQSLSFSVNGTYATLGYRDIAAVNGAPVPKSTLNASMGYSFGQLGQRRRRLHRIRSRDGRCRARSVAGRGVRSLFSSPRVALATMSYSAPIAGLASFYATGFKDLRDNHNYGVGFGISFALGPSTSASVGGSLDNGRATPSLSVSKYTQTENDYGYLVQDFRRPQPAAPGTGRVSQPMGRGRCRGGPVAGPGRRARWRERRAGLGGWPPVCQRPDLRQLRGGEHRRCRGRAGAVREPAGRHHQFQRASAGAVAVVVSEQPARGGYRAAAGGHRGRADLAAGAPVGPVGRQVVDFHVRKVLAAVLTLHDASGKAVPIGSVAKVEGAEAQPVGFDGQAYVTGLKPKNRVEVTLPDGKSCSRAVRLSGR